MCTRTANEPGRPATRMGQSSGSLRRLLFLVSLGLVLPTLPAHAACPDGTILADTPTPMSAPKTASDGAGGSYVVWLNYSSPSYYLFALRVDSSGRIVSGWPAGGLQVSTQAVYPPWAQYNIPGEDLYNICVDSSGRLVIVWISDGFRISAQRVGATPTLDWGTAGMSVFSTTYSERGPVIAADEDGGCFIAAEAGGDIYVQRINDNGTTWGAGGVVACNATGIQSQPSIAYVGKNNSVGYAVIAWTDARFTVPHIFAQLVDWNGVLAWGGTAGTAVCTVPGFQMHPIVGRGNNPREAYVVWSDGRGGQGISTTGGGSLYAQRLYANGNLAWIVGGLVVRSNPQDGSFQVPVAAVPAPDGVTFIWQNFYLSNGQPTWDSVLGVRLLDSGAIQGSWAPGGTLIAGPNDVMGSHSAVGDGAGGFAMSGRHFHNPGVYAIRFLPNGVPAWTPRDPAMSLDALGPEPKTSVALLAGGGLFVAWSHAGDIYEQATSSDGTATIVTIPPKPTNVAATECVGNGVTVTWDDVCGETEYHIYRSGTDIATVSANATTYFDPNHLPNSPPGGNYEYCVRSYRASSGLSDAGCDMGCMPAPPPSLMNWKIQETSLEDVDPNRSLAMALGAGDSPNMLFSSLTGGRPQFAKPVAGWFYPENPLNQNGGVANASIAVDANGNPHLSYIEFGQSELAYLKKVDGVWSYEQVIPTWETSIYYNSLRLTPQGVPHIARVDSQGRLVITWKDGSNWVHPLVPGAVTVSYPSLAMNALGEPRVSYAETNGRLRYVERTGASTWTMSGILGNATYSSLAVNGQGNPKIAWYDPGPRTLMYSERINNNWSTPVTVYSVPTAGQPPSLALDAAGLPRIAHYNNGMLLYSWRDANGTWSTTLVDGNGDAGVSPSLALNSQGNPRIAYLDAASRRPRYAVSPADSVPPNEAHLTVTFGPTTAVVQWNAPGDDGTNGQAVEYDLRYAMNGISHGTFLTATRLPTPDPMPAGYPQAVSLSGLNCGQAYAFMLMTRDESNNWSDSPMAQGAASGCSGEEVEYSSHKDGQSSAPATLQFSRSTSNPSRGNVRFRVGVPEAQRGAREELLLFDVTG